MSVCSSSMSARCNPCKDWRCWTTNCMTEGQARLTRNRTSSHGAWNKSNEPRSSETNPFESTDQPNRHRRSSKTAEGPLAGKPAGIQANQASMVLTRSKPPNSLASLSVWMMAQSSGSAVHLSVTRCRIGLAPMRSVRNPFMAPERNDW